MGKLFSAIFILPFTKTYIEVSKIFMCCTPETYYLWFPNMKGWIWWPHFYLAMGRNTLQLNYQHGNKSDKVKMICLARDKCVGKVCCVWYRGQSVLSLSLDRLSSIRKFSAQTRNVKKSFYLFFKVELMVCCIIYIVEYLNANFGTRQNQLDCRFLKYMCVSFFYQV